jgi:hypothetical protein
MARPFLASSPAHQPPPLLRPPERRGGTQALSMMTTKAAALGTITIASHQVLVGVLTVAQFCPEPLSQAAQTFLANTAGALRKGTATPAERRFTRRAGRLLLGCAVRQPPVVEVHSQATWEGDGVDARVAGRTHVEKKP